MGGRGNLLGNFFPSHVLNLYVFLGVIYEMLNIHMTHKETYLLHVLIVYVFLGSKYPDDSLPHILILYLVLGRMARLLNA